MLDGTELFCQPAALSRTEIVAKHSYVTCLFVFYLMVADFVLTSVLSIAQGMLDISKAVGRRVSELPRHIPVNCESNDIDDVVSLGFVRLLVVFGVWLCIRS